MSRSLVYRSGKDKQTLEAKHIWDSLATWEPDILLLGDSMIKYVNFLRDTQIISYRGIKIFELGARIFQGKIPQMASAKRLVMFHIGTNNITLCDPYEIIRQINFLVDTTRSWIPNVPIAIAHILPRPIDFGETMVKVNTVNYLLEHYQHIMGIDIIPISRPFTMYGLPIQDLFAIDGLHLSGLGTQVYRSYIGRVLGRLCVKYAIPRSGRLPPPTMIWGKI
jgi:hypothetical protein